MGPQAHSTISTVANPEKYDKSLYDVLMTKGERIEDIIVRSNIPGLDMSITKISMAKLEPSLSGEFDAHYRLKDALEQVRGKYQYIFIDTPPTLGLITLNALVAANYILIPIQILLSLPGGDRRSPERRSRRSRRFANPHLKVLGVVITLLR
ncbi:MAG: AAA family ATPase [Candidatus Moduliflexus flocculans]|nr:AAA family ATPase [Candidatus Moduliflexus flocculans]